MTIHRTIDHKMLGIMAIRHHKMGWAIEIGLIWYTIYFHWGNK